MIKNRKILIAIFVSIIVTLSCAGSVKATDVNLKQPRTVEEEGKNESDTSGIIDSKFVEGVYKSSDDKSKSYLPFFRYAKDRLVIDEEVSKMGALFSGSSIDINAPLKGGQLLFSSGSTRIGSEMEYGIIMANGNVVIDSNIQRSIIVFSTGTVTITENAVLSEDIVCIADAIEVKGTVEGSVVGSATSCNVSGTIGHDLRLNTTDLNIETLPKGNVYIVTYNSEISNKYPEIEVKLLENKTNNTFSVKKITGIITKCLVFALLYVLINKISNKKVFDKFLETVKTRTTAVILSGALALILIIPAFLVLMMLGLIDLWFITIPIMVIYLGFIIVVSMLSTFIVGSTIFRYVKEKYIKKGGFGTDIIGIFFTLIGLYLIMLIPYAGWYISVASLIFATGILIASIFKGKK